ncbi:MAG: type II secretion system F family protein [Proteobacteria bacterium]|nr:type II secretion system F family protein [Pseudomonadota bacterium]
MLAVLAALLGFVTIAGFGFAFAGGAENERLLKRAQGVTRDTREGTRARVRQGGAVNDPTQRRKQLLQNLKEVDRKQRKASLSLNSKLQQAGLTFSPTLFWIVSGVLGLVFALLPMMAGLNPLIGLGLGVVIGFGVPRWAIGMLGNRRLAKFTEEFPNAMDIIVRGIKSGLPVHDCLKIIGQESPEPLGLEFRRMIEQIGMGMTVEDALEKTYERMPTSELRFFAIVLSIQQKTGGNLAEALGNLSVVLRARKMMREKIKAMSGEAVASAAIIGVLPPGVMALVTVMTPSYMMVMYTDPRGQMLLAGGAMWMAIGGFIMKRMINFKI